jgi:hypothetical protein
MNERLIKQWEVTQSLLNSAATEVLGTPAYEQYRNFIGHNELELALDVLEDIGHERPVSSSYWWNLKKAAEVMGLHQRYAALRTQWRLAEEEDKMRKQ